MPQSLSSILVHLVFSTKNRAALLTPLIEIELYKYLAIVFREMKSPAIIIGGDADHVHVLFNLGRTVTLSDVVEEIKTSSSKWLKTKGNGFQDFHWQRGYGAFSVSESNAGAVKEYIANQKEHHRKKSFQDEFRGLCRNYKVEFDEKYVWD